MFDRKNMRKFVQNFNDNLLNRRILYNHLIPCLPLLREDGVILCMEDRYNKHYCRESILY